MKTILYIYMCMQMYSNENCFEVYSAKYIIDSILQKKSISFEHFSFQLETNLAYVYEINTGEIIIIPNNYASSEARGIIFSSSECFKYYLDKDSFPIIDNEGNIFAEKMEWIKSIPESIDTIRNRLNEVTGKAYANIDRATVDAYYKKMLEIRHKKDSEILIHMYIEMSILIGEVLREEKKGKWALLKRYGDFNPYFVPVIIDEMGGVYEVSSIYYRYVESPTSDIEQMYRRFNMIGGKIKAKDYPEGMIILL